MKIRKGFVLREINGETVAVPVGELCKQFHKVVHLNKTAVDIWHGMEAGNTTEEIAAALVEKYNGVTLEQAEQCVRNVSEQLKEHGLLE